MFAESILLIGLLWLLYKLFLERSKLHAIPGPKQLPIVGNALQVDPDKFHVNFLTWCKQYGPIARFRLLNEEFVLVSDLDLIHEVLVTRGHEFAGRMNSYRIEVMSEGYKDIPMSDWNDEVKWRRKVMHSHIKQYGSGIDTIERVTNGLASNFVQDLSDAGQDNKPVELNHRFYSLTMDILSVLLIGDVLEDKETKDMMSMIFPLLDEGIRPSLSGILLDTFPWTRYLGNPTWKTFQELKRKRQKLVSTLIEIQSKNEDNKGFIKQLLQTFEEDVHHDASYEVLEQQISGVIVAGTLTTSATLTALTNVLVHHPHVQENLQKEVARVVGFGRDVSIKDKAEMPYHVATLYEILRLASISVFIPHKTMKDTSLGGYSLPKNTVLFVNLFAMHHDETFWDDPWSFKPERFLDEDGCIVPADHPNKKHLKPFSAGTRVCVGEIFANSRLFLVLAKLMQNFTFLPATTLKDQPPFDPRLHNCVTGAVKPPKIEVRLQPLDS